MKKGLLLDKALSIAISSHSGQLDKGDNPYILHPLKVMHYIKSNDEELQCIALLHDVVEDCDVTYEQLRDMQMTERVIEGVRCLTKIAGESYNEYKEKVFGNRDAMRVKMADLRHNTDIRRTKGVTDKDMARLNRYITFYKEIEERLQQ